LRTRKLEKIKYIVVQPISNTVPLDYIKYVHEYHHKPVPFHVYISQHDIESPNSEEKIVPGCRRAGLRRAPGKHPLRFLENINKKAIHIAVVAEDNKIDDKVYGMLYDFIALLKEALDIPPERVYCLGHINKSDFVIDLDKEPSREDEQAKAQEGIRKLSELLSQPAPSPLPIFPIPTIEEAIKTSPDLIELMREIKGLE
jgi:hypothetical protein